MVDAQDCVCPWWGQQNWLPVFSGSHPWCRQDMEHLVPAGTSVGAPATTPSASGELLTSTQLHQHCHCCPGTATITPAQPLPPHPRAHHRGNPAVACAPRLSRCRKAAARAARQCRLHTGLSETEPLHPAGSTQQGAPSRLPWACARPCPRQHPWPAPHPQLPAGAEGLPSPRAADGACGCPGKVLGVGPEAKSSSQQA